MARTLPLPNDTFLLVAVTSQDDKPADPVLVMRTSGSFVTYPPLSARSPASHEAVLVPETFERHEHRVPEAGIGLQFDAPAIAEDYCRRGPELAQREFLQFVHA